MKILFWCRVFPSILVLDMSKFVVLLTLNQFIMKKLILLCAGIVFLNSCSSYNLVSENDIKVKGIKLKGDKRVSFVIYDATTKKTFTLSEPPPDAIMEKATKLANIVGIKNNTTNTDINTSQQIELANNVIQLGERTVAVNILRDALFRLSEMNVNNRNTKLEDSYKTLFDSIISCSKQVALADILKLKVKKEQAETEKIKQETEKIKSEIELKELDFNLGCKVNYQTALNFLLEKNVKNSLSSFKELYEKYPTHYFIDEINSKLKELNKDGMSDSDWKLLFKFIIKNNTNGINEEIKNKLIEIDK